MSFWLSATTIEQITTVSQVKFFVIWALIAALISLLMLRAVWRYYNERQQFKLHVMLLPILVGYSILAMWQVSRLIR